MSAITAPRPQALQGPLLAAVSRSFYLSLRFLPPPVRGPLSVSYLLARAADTIADVEASPADERIALLDALGEAMQAEARPLPGFLEDVREFSERVEHPGERELLRRLDECFGKWRKLSEGSRGKVQEVMSHILRGMKLDLERFPDASRLRCLEVAGELDEYTWLVAGCVGGFWTDVCHLELPGVFKRPVEEVNALGQAYGKGLQLINILRDQAGDAQLGRCYLPRDLLQAAGLQGPVIWPAADWKPWHQVRQDLIRKAREGLSEGWEYADSLRSIRLRFAVLMPLLIGEATLAMMEALPAGGPPGAVKVSRPEVKKLARTALWMALTGRIRK